MVPQKWKVVCKDSQKGRRNGSNHSFTYKWLEVREEKGKRPGKYSSRKIKGVISKKNTSRKTKNTNATQSEVSLVRPKKPKFETSKKKKHGLTRLVES